MIGKLLSRTPHMEMAIVLTLVYPFDSGAIAIEQTICFSSSYM